MTRGKKAVIGWLAGCGLLSALCLGCDATGLALPGDDEKPEEKHEQKNASAFQILQELEKQKQTLQNQLQQKQTEIQKHTQAHNELQGKKACRMSQSSSLSAFCATKTIDQNICEEKTKIDGAKLCAFAAESGASCTFPNHTMFCKTMSAEDADGYRCHELGMTTGIHSWNICSSPAPWPSVKKLAVAVAVEGAGICDTAHGDPCAKLWTAQPKQDEANCKTIKVRADLRGTTYQGKALDAVGGAVPAAEYVVNFGVDLGIYSNICNYRPEKKASCVPDSALMGDPCTKLNEATCETQGHGLCVLYDLHSVADSSDDDS